MIPGDFFVQFKVNIPEELIIAGLVDCAFDEVVLRAYTQKRNALRSEKVRPWGLSTYRPLRGQLQDAKPSFSEMLRIAEEVIDEIGMSMSPKSRAMRRKYEWKQILAGLLLNEFVIDGMGIPCDSLVLRVAAMQKQLAKETEEITILTRLIMNTVRAVSLHTNKISALSASLEPGSIIYTGPEYDVKENYSDAE